MGQIAIHEFYIPCFAMAQRSVLHRAGSLHPRRRFAPKAQAETGALFEITFNDLAFGAAFKARVRAMGIRDRPTSFRSPWQNGYVERLIGSIRQECLDHLIVLRRAPSACSSVQWEAGRAQ